VFFSLGGFCSHAYKADLIARFGGVGAIFGQLSSIPPSWDSMAQDQELAPQLTIPVNFVAVSVSQYIIGAVTTAAAQNSSLIATMTYQDDPIFVLFQTPGWAFVQCAFCIWFGVCGIVSIVKLILFIQEQGGIQATIPQICLFLCLFTCIWTSIALTLNLLGSRNNTSQLTMVVLREWTAVAWLMPVIVFPFYWGELIASSQPVVGLKESKLPFLVAIFIIQGLTLGTVIVKGLYGSNPDLIRAQICTVVILCGLFGIYFVVQGVRVIVALGKMQDGFGKTPVQRRTTFLFLCLALLLFGITANFSVSFSPTIGDYQDFLAFFMFFPYVFAALGMAIIVFILSPKALKEAGAKMSSSIFSGGSMRSDSKSSDAVELDKPKKHRESTEDQLAETKITI
jgi:hypothetical protein